MHENKKLKTLQRVMLLSLSLTLPLALGACQTTQSSATDASFCTVISGYDLRFSKKSAPDDQRTLYALQQVEASCVGAK